MMKFKMVLFLCFLMMLHSIALSEQKTEFVFNEFRVLISDEYVTYTKQNILEINGNNTTLRDLNMYLDYMTTDESLYLDAAHYKTGDEIRIVLAPLDNGLDFRMLKGLDEKYISVFMDGYLQSMEAGGVHFASASSYFHPQTVFITGDAYHSYWQGSIVMYYTIAKIDNRFYAVTIGGISPNGTISDSFRNDIQETVGSLKLTGYPDYALEEEKKTIELYTSDFKVIDGICFGKTLDEVLKIENELGNNKSKIYNNPTWQRAMTPYDRSYKTLGIYNTTILGIDYSSKSYMFDENDMLYSVSYGFRSGYNDDGMSLNLDGQTDINNFLPAYNTIELFLRDQYGNPHFQMSKGSKCEINGYGMNDLMNCMDTEYFVNLCDYSEWIIDDSQGSIKVEHILYSTKNFYIHNVTMEILR